MPSLPVPPVLILANPRQMRKLHASLPLSHCFTPLPPPPPPLPRPTSYKVPPASPPSTPPSTPTLLPAISTRICCSSLACDRELSLTAAPIDAISFCTSGLACDRKVSVIAVPFDRIFSVTSAQPNHACSQLASLTGDVHLCRSAHQGAASRVGWLLPRCATRGALDITPQSDIDAVLDATLIPMPLPRFSFARLTRGSTELTVSGSLLTSKKRVPLTLKPALDVTRRELLHSVVLNVYSTDPETDLVLDVGIARDL